VRRSEGRSDRGFCKIEGRINWRRWNRSEKVESRFRRSKVRFFETPVLRSLQAMDLGFFIRMRLLWNWCVLIVLRLLFYSNAFSKPATEWRGRRWDIEELIGRRRHTSRSHLFSSEPATEWRGRRRRRLYGTIKS